jgi:hypothetical protein
MPKRAPEKKKQPESVTLFVGPTLAANAAARALAKPYRLRRPIRRHDVDAMVEAQRKARKKPGVLVIVDGVFHDTLAVGHAEIRDAMAAGWKVWGMSSMGAIRAREMSNLGMRGYGEVYQRFALEEDFQDDEVTLLHETTAPYKGVTEPLVHLRVAVDDLVKRGVVPAQEGASVIAELKSQWYGERTVRGMVEAFRQRDRARGDRVAAEVADFQRFRVKTQDLERFFEEKPWIATA